MTSTRIVCDRCGKTIEAWAGRNTLQCGTKFWPTVRGADGFTCLRPMDLCSSCARHVVSAFKLDEPTDDTAELRSVCHTAAAMLKDMIEDPDIGIDPYEIIENLRAAAGEPISTRP